MGETTITGGCHCGAVTFNLSAAPLLARTCWCGFCQHIGGGGPTVNVVFPAEALSVQGAVTDYPRIADSGAHPHSGFCPKCGSQLFSRADERPHLVIVRAGALDDPDIISPACTIWTDDAPRWACIDADLPQHPRQAPSGT
jgi:hypothetical protein